MNTQPRIDTVAMTAAFLAVGMMGCAFFKCAQARYIESEEGGQIELVAALTSYASIIATIFDNEEREFPGGFHYEVTEPFGVWFTESLCATGELPDGLVGIEKIAELVEGFFSQGGNHD